MPSMTDNLPREHGFEPLEIEGRLPEGLRGTLYRNGAALTERFGVRYRHVFEGDGGIAAARLDGAGGASGACRLVRTPSFLEEEAAGRMLSGFSAPWLTRMRAQFAGKSRNMANTSVLAWEGRLFALMEGAAPAELDADTLETLGESDLDGALLGAYSAHPHRVASTRTLFNFGQVYGKDPRLELYAWPEGGACRRLGAVALPTNMLVHDFIATEKHLVFFLGPAVVSAWRAVLGIGSFDTLLRWAPERGTQVVVVPLADPEAAVRFETEPFWVWHFANAWEEGDTLVVDYARYPDFGSIGEIGEEAGLSEPPMYHRARVDVSGRRVVSEAVSALGCEFPVIHPGRAGAPHRSAWVQWDKDGVQGIARVSMADGAVDAAPLPEGWKSSEPLFAPKPGASREEEGWLLAMEYDAGQHRSAVAVYDAERVGEGAVARAWFDHHVHMTFHGVWVEG